MLFADQEVRIVKNCALGLCTDLGQHIYITKLKRFENRLRKIQSGTHWGNTGLSVIF